jgi:large subunit ribosomal protein L13
MKTSVIPISAPVWYVVDAEGQTIGGIATKAAHVLRGKHKPSFAPHQLCGDHVIILNVEKLSVLPKKLITKMYVRHSGYLGHLRTKTLGKMMEEKPEDVMLQAIRGMLPRNRLKFQMLKRLHILTGSEHKYAAQKPVPLNLPTL